MAPRKSGSASAGNNSPTNSSPARKAQQTNGGEPKSDTGFQPGTSPIKFYDEEVKRIHEELQKREDLEQWSPRRVVQRVRPPPRGGVTIRGFLARVAIFYALIAYFLVCPTDSTRSRAVCRGFDSAQARLAAYEPLVRPYVHTAQRKIDPYLQQVEAKAEPYLTVARPYYRKVNSVVRPLAGKLAQVYATKVHPRVLEAISASQKATKPYVEHAKETYRKTLAPSVEWYSRSARAWWAAKAAPHVALVTDTAQLYWNQVYDYLSPLYFKGVPLVQKYYHGTVLPVSRTAYKTTRTTYVNQIHPRLITGAHHSHVFYKTKVLPALHRFYSLYIAPQVAKISAKIFEYRTQKEKADAVAHVAEVEAEIVKEHGAEDFEYLIAELRDTTYTDATAEAVAPEPSATEVPPTPEELKAATAAKRAALEALSTTYEKEIAKLGQVQQDLLVQRLVEIRTQAVDDIPMRFTQTTLALDEEGDKMVGRLGKYFSKVASDEKLSAQEKVDDAEFLATKATAKVGKMARDAFAEVADYRHSLEIREKAAVESASEALSALVTKAQEELSFGWTWLDNVRVADWTRFHQLAKVDSNFKAYYSGLQSGAVKDDALAEVDPLAALLDVEKELNETVDAFEAILSKIKIKGQKELKGEWTGVGNEAQKAFEAVSVKAADIVEAVQSSASSLAGVTPTPTDLQGTASSIASIAQESVASLVSSAYDAVPTLPPLPTPVVDTFSTLTEGVSSGVSQAASLADAAASAVVVEVPAALESVLSIASSLGEAVLIGAGESASQLAAGAGEGVSTAASVISSYTAPHPAFASAASVPSHDSADLGAKVASAIAAASGEPSKTFIIADDGELTTKNDPTPTNVAASIVEVASSAVAQATDAAASVLLSDIPSVVAKVGEGVSSASSVLSSYAAPHPAYAKSSASAAAASRAAHVEL